MDTKLPNRSPRAPYLFLKKPAFLLSYVFQVENVHIPEHASHQSHSPG
jgi:hypothetical protein